MHIEDAELAASLLLHGIAFLFMAQSLIVEMYLTDQLMSCCSQSLRRAGQGDLKGAAQAAADAAMRQSEPAARAMEKAAKEAAVAAESVAQSMQGKQAFRLMLW